MRTLFFGLLVLSVLLPSPLEASSRVRLNASRKIVTFSASQEQRVSIVSESGEVVREFREQRAVAAELTDAAAQALERREDVVSVLDDPYIMVAGRGQEMPWGVRHTGAERVWSTTQGAGALVAVVDTGVDLDHPDLSGAIRGQINIVDSRRSADDDNGHGTHVAGIIAARHNEIGVVGVAPASSLLAIKVLDRRGGGYLSDIVAGITWAVDHGAQVINLSLGSNVDLPLFREAVRAAQERGVLVVAASGNSGGPVLYPAAYPEVLAVGMIDDRSRVHRASSRGPELDVVAPGESIASTYKGGRYRSMTGTSMAAPHVSGAIALLLTRPARCDQSGDGRCSPAEVRHTLEATAVDLAPTGWDAASGAGVLSVAGLLGL